MELTTAELARRLGVTPRRALGLLADGKIAGRRLSSGAWLADSNSVTLYEQTSRRGSGRRLSSAASWAVLWELSGLEVNWLSKSTHARVRRLIRETPVAELALIVADRTSEHRYRAANVELANAGLILTGRVAAARLAEFGVELSEDSRRVAGYLAKDLIRNYAAQNFLLASADGPDVIYENTLPIAYTDSVMPAAVVAADLSRSTNVRERAAGQLALEELRRIWLAKR